MTDNKKSNEGVITYRVSPKEKVRLQRVARARKQTLSYLVATICREFLRKEA